jgi:hypothetical protein
MLKNQTIKLFIVIIATQLVLSFLVFAGCTSQKITTVPTTSNAVTLHTILITPFYPSIYLNSSKRTLQLTATGYYLDRVGEDITDRVTWFISDTTVATISPTGLVTATEKTGNAIITAEFSGVTSPPVKLVVTYHPQAPTTNSQ